MSDTRLSTEDRHQGSAVETAQSLIVAFVLAMTFRGFVTEGFVIPTGSMAPTLMGRHLLLHSDQTGVTYPIDTRIGRRNIRTGYDPMLGRNYPLDSINISAHRPRMGDRILVLKCLYPFAEPQRFDVVVFKNPTDPDGDAENYIKRLIGLPNEAIWLVDGDLFVGSADDPDNFDAYEIKRKPLHLQRAAWQPVHHSDYIPIRPERFPRRYSAPWFGENWKTTNSRSYRCDTVEPSTLQWSLQQIALDDWVPYNMLSFRGSRLYPVSDLRVTAAILPDQAGLETTLELETRGHLFQFVLTPYDEVMYEAVVRMRPIDESDEWVLDSGLIVAPKPGQVFNIEFWHVDQSMAIYFDGNRVAYCEYSWPPRRRLELAYGGDYETVIGKLPTITPTAPSLRWDFRGSPVTLHRVQVDRDLYYRPERLDPTKQKNDPQIDGPAFGTHPDNLAILGPDHFYMLGDNSPASSDSRLWGRPHPLVAKQIDDSPFVVNRKLLLGKAWVVYFPAPYPVTEGGRGVIPDFARLRFVR
ncbi:MAG: hypothetical protein IH830_05530 [Planctomycetes bacterium]|nr:hypothetical protein [Planctomycetota bacterium]